MNKIELAKEIAGRMSVSVAQSLRFVETMCTILGESIEKNETVLIQNFGHFQPWAQKERQGRNPRTGVECPIPERISIKFKPGKGLLEKLNKKEGGVEV